MDTQGTDPDAVAAKVALSTLSKYVGITVDLSNVDSAASQTKKVLESFGLIKNIQDEKKKEEEALRWYI